MIIAVWEYIMLGGLHLNTAASIRTNQTCCPDYSTISVVKHASVVAKEGTGVLPGWQGGSSTLAPLCQSSCHTSVSVYPPHPNASKNNLPAFQPSGLRTSWARNGTYVFNSTRGFFFHEFVWRCLKSHKILAVATSCGKKYQELNHEIYKSILNL